MGPTELCNMALGRIGSARIDTYDADQSIPAQYCRLFYEQTRDSLIRSHRWRFARDRATLSANAEYEDDDNTFEYDYAYDLPNDFLAMQQPYEGVPGLVGTHYNYSAEGKQILSNEDEMEIRYIKKVVDPNEFDPLFIEVLVLQLAIKLVMPLSGGGGLGENVRLGLYHELNGTPQQPGLMSKVRQMDKEETNTAGENLSQTWNDAMESGGRDPLYL